MVYPPMTQLWNYQDIYFGSGLVYAVLLLFYPCISLFNTMAMPVCVVIPYHIDSLVRCPGRYNVLYLLSIDQLHYLQCSH